MVDQSIAYFVSPHGFGHAARASAVMDAIHNLAPATRFEIFTLVPQWFFDDSLSFDFGYHPVLTDVGLVQESALREDMPATLRRLDELYPFRPERVDQLARQVTGLSCEAVVCDIAPLGIAVAQAAGLTSFLVENFTWDWIYSGYVDDEPRLQPYITYLHDVLEGARYHIQTEPVCYRASPGERPANLVTRPVSRRPRMSRDAVRAGLGIPVTAPAVLITMGGIPEQHTFLDRLFDNGDIHFIIPGGTARLYRTGNVHLLPYRSDYYHPDLVNASDAVVGKSGYSTVAEAYYAGIPFGYISRARFPEAARVAGFIKQEMQGFEIGELDFGDGTWLARLPDLLALPKQARDGSNGSVDVATFVLGHV